MTYSNIDALFRKILLNKFFAGGWGSPKNLKTLIELRKTMSNRDTCCNLVKFDYPIHIKKKVKKKNYEIIDGYFDTPMKLLVPNIIKENPAIEKAHFQMILPTDWGSSGFKPICIHLAGTGDHYYYKRRNFMAKPLLKEHIGAILLENPYYGERKPENQGGSSLRYVTDLIVMGGCLILECMVLLYWCERMGYGPLGITGLSMGGHMASVAATNYPKPLVLVPCLSWSTASTVFTEGVISDSVDWDNLQKQYKNEKILNEDLSKICTIVDNPFKSKFSLTGECLLDSNLKEVPCNENSLSPYFMIKLTEKTLSNYETSILCQPSSEEKKPFNPYELLVSKQVLLPLQSRKKAVEIKNRNIEALWLMKGIMDECTHLKNYSVPVDTELITAICAISDGYVTRTGTSGLDEIWPGAKIKYIDSDRKSVV